MRLLIVFVVIYFGFFNAYAQLSKTHYIPPITTESTSANSRAGEQYLHISSPVTTTFNIEVSLSGVKQSFTLSNNNPLEIYLGTGNTNSFVVDVNLTSNKITDSGIIIESEEPVYASVRLLSGIESNGNASQAGSLVSKGLAGLGKDFRAGTFTSQRATSSLWLNFISVMAIEDGTVIDFQDVDADVDYFHNGAQTSNILLDRGEVYILCSLPTDNLNGDAFIGARIVSNKNIVVNSGSTNGSNDVANGRDFGIDQIAPLSTIQQSSGDSEYIFIRGNGSGNANIERPIIVANEDNTQVSIGGTLYSTLQFAGDYVSIDESMYSSSSSGANMYVYTDKTTYAFQGIGGASNAANQELFFVPPLSCKTPSNIDNIPAIDEVGSSASQTFEGNVGIVTRRFNKGTSTPNIVQINGFGLPTSSAQSVQGTDFDGDGLSDYVTYLDSNLAGDVSISSNESIYVSYFGRDGSAAMGGFYSGFIFKSEITSELEIGADQSCIDFIDKLELSSLEDFDTYQWYYKQNSNDTPLPISGATSEVLDFNNPPSGVTLVPGFYQLEGVIYDSDAVTICESIFSPEIPVSVCSGNTDNDSINNNIDVDIDNDGILNTDESNCNFQFDLSNNSGPNFNSSQFVNSADNLEVSQGFSDQSILLSASSATSNSSDVVYELIFDAPTSFSFTQANSTDNAASSNTTMDDNELYVVSVPSTHTLSIYDPDDQLLIDTNYDGIFESNTTQFTSFEIRFKLNGVALNNGQGTFQIRSNLAPSIQIKYINLDESNSNTSAFKLSQACRDIDSDGDSVMNSYDLDTDNDGIYDVIESGNYRLDLDSNGTLETFLDLNFDGVIDATVFVDSNGDGFHDDAINPIDTDNDTIPNYLDTDSDGDTISDLIEGGNYRLDLDSNGTFETFLDLNFDGVIDAAVFADSNYNDGFHDAANPRPLNSDFNNDSTDKIPDNPDDGKPDYIDEDSDDDVCDDKYESGLTAAATSFNYPDDINTNGIFDFQEYVAILPKALPLEISACENGTYTLKLELKDASYSYDKIVWQNSTDNGSNWNNLSDSPFYSGTTTNELLIKNIPIGSNNFLFKAILSRNDYACWPTESTSAKLKVNPLPQVSSSWSGELIQCDNDTDGISMFNLLEVKPQLSANYANEDFEFYTDITDLSSLIPNPEAFENTTSNSIDVRIISDQGCYIDEPIDLRAVNNDLPAAVLDQHFKECYDYGDNKTSFNFSDAQDSSGNPTNIPISDYITDAINIANSDTVNRTVSFYENYNDALLELNAIPDISNYEISGYPEGGFVKLWVRVDDEFNSCNGIKELITLEVLPDISFEIDSAVLNPNNLTDKEVLICNSGTALVKLNLETPNNKTKLIYEWILADNTIQTTIDPELEVSEEGNYKITVKYEDCALSENFKVSIYAINDPQLDFFDLVSGTKRNAIQLKDPNDESAFGLNNYKFLLIDEAGNAISNELPYYQELCVFEDLTGGFYTLVVRDEAQCDEKSIVIPILYFPTFITPNGDGYNDTWEVKGIDLDDYNLDLTKLYIFNRYGKLLGSIGLDQSWDGTFNGSPLEATDYWYKVDLVRKSGEVLQPIRGHFSLLK